MSNGLPSVHAITVRFNLIAPGPNSGSPSASWISEAIRDAMVAAMQKNASVGPVVVTIVELPVTVGDGNAAA